MVAEVRRQVLLVVEDEVGVRNLLTKTLSAPGRDVIAAATGEEGREALASRAPGVLVLDLMLPDASGADILRESLEHDPNCMVIVLTARADERSVVEAMQLGAMEYLTKPFEVEDLQVAVDRAFEKRRRSREAAEIRESDPPPLEGLLIGKSPKMVEIYKMIGMLARSDVPVLITGESGTGKELVAKALHIYGARSQGKMIPVDCASLPGNLLESELFGYERGAFTGAVVAKPGKFELADGGTIFLDEIGNVPLELQAKLLRALQEHSSQRLGSNHPVKWDARVVSATNTDLRGPGSEGRFREDLFFRLAGAEIGLPPLRDRGDDVALLADHFLVRGAARAKKVLSPEAIMMLKAYAWPGNVRELEHVIERAVAMSRSSVIGPEDLTEEIRGVKKLASLGLTSGEGRGGLVALEEVKRRYARHAVAVCGGNKTEAAKLLDIDRSTMSSLLKDG